MKPDEKLFFVICITFRTAEVCTIRDVVRMFDGVIPRKRCWYLLSKWSGLGFYDYGVNLELGWFDAGKLPERYKACLIDFNLI